ncbi:MAG: DUF6912 family protein [Mycobacteriales bacterium]
MRVYFASNWNLLGGAAAGGELGPAPITGFAVTPALREWYIDDDEEELEYAAFTEAARGSLRLIDSDALSVRRRVVISADVDDATVEFRSDLDRAVVRVSTPLPMERWACVHVDSEEAEPTIAAAADAVIPADLGDVDSQFAMDAALGHELEWYDVSELNGLLKTSRNS